MKKIHLIPVLILGLFISCKDSSNPISPSIPSNSTPVGLIEYEEQLREEVKNHPSINAPIIEQHQVKNIEAFLKLSHVSAVFSYQYTYYGDGKIKSISGDNRLIEEFIYKDNKLMGSQTFLLNKEGLAQSIDGNDITKFFYKDGYLLRTNVKGDFKYTYSENGNLLKATKGNESLNYIYTAYPNTIRQEILKIQEFSHSIRDFYLGRYSTNLIKEIKYNDLTVMTFDYEFDNLKRVTKIIMNGTTPLTSSSSNNISLGPPANIEYILSY